MPRAAGLWHRVAAPRHRGWLQAVAITVALAALATAGASGVLTRGPSPTQLARADAAAQARADYLALGTWPARVWSAEQLGRRASALRGAQLLSVTGTTSASWAGVQLVIQVIGHTAATRPPLDTPACFTLDFGRAYHARVRATACPDTGPLRYPPFPVPAALPAEPALRAAVTAAVDELATRVALTGASRATALGTAVPALRLDPRVRVAIGATADTGGLALETYDPADLEYACLLLRLGAAGIDVWRPPPPAPGVSPPCTGQAAATGLGLPAPVSAGVPIRAKAGHSPR